VFKRRSSRSLDRTHADAMTTPAVQQRFQTLVDEHRGIIFKVCGSYCRGADDREDLAQEIIAQLWRSFPRFDDRKVFSTWMYRVALNVAISFVRREVTRTRHVISADGRVLEASDEAAAKTADVGPLYGFIERLDPLNKALILLYLDEKSHAEIATVLGLSESNVGTKISRMKASMKKEYAAHVKQA
jgi:RNA polymerase sigma-70 factor (ECF subfamily)